MTWGFTHPRGRGRIEGGSRYLIASRQGAPVSDSVVRDLERRWRETGSREDEIAWLRERVRAGEPSLTDDELLQRLRARPHDDELRRILASWFGAREGPRGEYLRAEIELNAAPRDGAVRQRLLTARARCDATFVSTIEQPSLLRVCPLPVPTA